VISSGKAAFVAFRTGGNLLYSAVMAIPLVDLRAQYETIRPEIDAAIARVLASTAFTASPETAAFEQAFADYCGARHCIGVSSGTAALEIILRAYGIGAGDEVIVPSHTFSATAAAVALTGAQPVFVDVDAETALMDPALADAAVTPRTKAIIPVDLYGQIADMDPILAIARKRKLKVIEDACQAHGAVYKGKRAGSLADAAAFSFYPGKNLGAYGEAGAIVTDDADVDTFARLFREHGSPVKYEHKIVGRNDRMDGIQGAVLAAKLPHLDAWNAARRSHAARYRLLLGNDPRIRFVAERGDGEHVYHLCVIRIADRDRVRAILNAADIGAGIHYPGPLHLQETYRGLGYAPGTFPHTEALAREILSLPLYPEMTGEQIEEVARAVLAAL
jgi:dTDP-4-amino-4,6-dideoxygalactose transaminase